MTKPSIQKERGRKAREKPTQAESFVRGPRQRHRENRTHQFRASFSSSLLPPSPALAHRIQLPTPDPAPGYAAIPRPLFPTRNLVRFAGEILHLSGPSPRPGREGDRPGEPCSSLLRSGHGRREAESAARRLFPSAAAQCQESLRIA